MLLHQRSEILLSGWALLDETQLPVGYWRTMLEVAFLLPHFLVQLLDFVYRQMFLDECLLPLSAFLAFCAFHANVIAKK